MSARARVVCRGRLLVGLVLAVGLVVGGTVIAGATAGDQTAADTAVADGVTVALEPEKPGVEPGENVTIEVTVTSPDRGVGAFSLALAVTNGSVARIAAVDYARSPDFDNTSVGDHGLTALFAAAQGASAHPAAERVVLGSVTLRTAAGGTTTLAVGTATVSDVNGTRYELVGRSNATLAVGATARTQARTTVATTRDDGPETTASTPVVTTTAGATTVTSAPAPTTVSRRDTSDGATAGTGAGFRGAVPLGVLVGAVLVARRSD